MWFPHHSFLEALGKSWHITVGLQTLTLPVAIDLACGGSLQVCSNGEGRKVADANFDSNRSNLE